jgi:DNA-binding XRE family transcriptional regulator
MNLLSSSGNQLPIIYISSNDKTYVIEEDNYENDLQIAQRIIESFGMTR